MLGLRYNRYTITVKYVLNSKMLCSAFALVQRKTKFELIKRLTTDIYGFEFVLPMNAIGKQNKSISKHKYESHLVGTNWLCQ